MVQLLQWRSIGWDNFRVREYKIGLDKIGRYLGRACVMIAQ